MDADVIVVGLGSVGSMTCWRLAEVRGAQVIGVEQHALGHDAGGARASRGCSAGPGGVRARGLPVGVWSGIAVLALGVPFLFIRRASTRDAGRTAQRTG